MWSRVSAQIDLNHFYTSWQTDENNVFLDGFHFSHPCLWRLDTLVLPYHWRGSNIISLWWRFVLGSDINDIFTSMLAVGSTLCNKFSFHINSSYHLCHIISCHLYSSCQLLATLFIENVIYTSWFSILQRMSTNQVNSMIHLLTDQADIYNCADATCMSTWLCHFLWRQVQTYTRTGLTSIHSGAQISAHMDLSCYSRGSSWGTVGQQIWHPVLVQAYWVQFKAFTV